MLVLVFVSNLIFVSFLITDWKNSEGRVIDIALACLLYILIAVGFIIFWYLFWVKHVISTAEFAAQTMTFEKTKSRLFY